MALPSSGAISIADIAKELGIDATGLSLGDGRCRSLAGRNSTEAVYMSDFYGKSNRSGADVSFSNASGYIGFDMVGISGAKFGWVTSDASQVLTYLGRTGNVAGLYTDGRASYIVLRGVNYAKTTFNITMYHKTLSGGSAAHSVVGNIINLSTVHSATIFSIGNAMNDDISNLTGLSLQLKVTY